MVGALIPTETRASPATLAHALEGVSISIRQLTLLRVEVNVLRAWGQLHDLRESLLGLRNAGRRDIVFGAAARSVKSLAAITTAALLVFDPEAVDDTPRPLAKIAELPSFNFAGACC
jgi:hypothetical protein